MCTKLVALLAGLLLLASCAPAHTAAHKPAHSAGNGNVAPPKPDKPNKLVSVQVWTDKDTFYSGYMGDQHVQGYGPVAYAIDTSKPGPFTAKLSTGAGTKDLTLAIVEGAKVITTVHTSKA